MFKYFISFIFTYSFPLWVGLGLLTLTLTHSHLFWEKNKRICYLINFLLFDTFIYFPSYFHIFFLILLQICFVFYGTPMTP